MTDIVGLIPDAAKALADAIKAVGDLAFQFRDRQKAAAQTNWGLVRDAAETAAKLVASHLQAVKVVAGEAKTGTLQGTAELMDQFVGNYELPSAYDNLHGGLRALIESNRFNDEANDAMRSLGEELRIYQRVAFLIGYDAKSWGLRDIIVDIAELHALTESSDHNSPGVRSRIDALARSLQDRNAWRSLRASPSNPCDETVSNAAPPTPAEMTQLVRTWMKAWQRDVEETLYGNTGVNHHAGVLLAMSGMSH